MSKMLAEIRQQPAALAKTLRSGLRQAQVLRRKFASSPPRLVVLAARGTSDNAAQFGRYLIEITTGIPVSLAAPSVSTLYHAPLRLEGALLVGISQSGESTDTNMVLEEGRKHGAATLGITNVADSTLARLADFTLLVRAGEEKSVAATKTYTGQLLTLYLLAWALGASIDASDLERLPEAAAEALKLEREVARRAERYRFMDHAVVIGRGLNYANAFEWALKMMETCYIVAERFSQADILHGPIAMVDRAFPAFVFAPAGVTWPEMKSLLARLEKIQAETLVVTDRSNREAPAGSLVVPAALSTLRRRSSPSLPEDLFTPIPYIIPAQIFAASLAAVKGLDPDRPRGLSKVTRTV
ncbi:MAG: SIS domain-containing protein [Bryobacteraceae bacterium]